MVAIALLSLLGWGLLASLFVDFGDDTEDPPVVENPPDNPDDTITVGDGDTVFAGAGNDTLTSDAPITGSSAFGGAGNDIINLQLDNGQIGGGNGDDDITMDTNSYASTIYGGAGNDTITSGTDAARSRISGGMGDDTINLDYTAGGSTEIARTDGGIGADTLNVDLRLNVASYDTSVTHDIKGGVGADVFNLNVEQGDIALDPTQPDDLTRDLIEIGDFTVGQDKLVIDQNGAVVSLVEDTVGGFTQVILTYPAIGTDPAVQGIITLVGVTGLTMDDIELVTPQEPDNSGDDTITIDSGETVLAGAGNDTITADTYVDGVDVYGGTGDDQIAINANSDIGVLQGDEGNDTISLNGGSYALEAYGGAGNDTLNADDGALRGRLFGEDGDDTFNLDHYGQGYDEVSGADGGDGADTFNVDMTLTDALEPNVVTPYLRGGAGADLFDLTIDRGAVGFGDAASGSLLTISDFVPGTDRLQIDDNGADITLTEAPDGSYTDVILTYSATLADPAVSGVIRLTGVSGLTVADIVQVTDTTPGLVTVSDNETVQAGSGDNPIRSDGFVENATVFGGAGNDSIDVQIDNSTLSGDDGNDVITWEGTTNTVFAGFGRDTLNVGQEAAGSRAFGGGGRDIFNIDQMDTGDDALSVFNGGGESDTFNVDMSAVARDVPDTASVELTGGVGNDVFDLDIQFGGSSSATAGAALSNIAINITDFALGQDMLLIDSNGGVVSLVEAAGGSYTDVILTYTTTQAAMVSTSVIRLTGVTGMTMADIVLQPATMTAAA